MQGKTAAGFLLFTSCLPPFAGGVLSLFALTGCVFYGAQSVTGFELLGNVWLKAAFYVFLVFSVLFFTVFFCAVKFACTAYFNSYAANGCRPTVFFSLRQAVRYLLCDLAKGAYTILWAALFFTPFAVTASSLLLLLRAGEVYLPVFITLSVCSLLLFVVGTVFFLLSCMRYFMCGYLLCSNPRMPVRDVLCESVFLMRGRAKKTLLFLLSFLPWMLLCVIPFFFPFVYVFVRTASVRLCTVYFGEETQKNKNGSAVIYYINGKTHFSEHAEETNTENDAHHGKVM